MGLEREPQSSLAAGVLPPPLYRALTHVFAQGIDGAMLAGGTALAGYYAGHRRSDDLDLFTEDPPAQRAAVLAVRSLEELGASLTGERTSARFHHATCRLDEHDFTTQVVLDSNLFVVGRGVGADDGVVVADPRTLLKMKAATLVSRAGEKDLYDLAWFFEHDDRLDVASLLALGKEIDSGMNGESVLVSLVGGRLQESSCGFALDRNPREVLAEVTRVRDALVRGIELYLREQAPPPIAALIRKLK